MNRLYFEDRGMKDKVTARSYTSEFVLWVVRAVDNHRRLGVEISSTVLLF